MKLENLKVTITKVEGACSRSKQGTVFFIKNGALEIPPGERVCMFALGSLLAPLIAAGLPTGPDYDILAVTREFQCPDPLAKVIFSVEKID